MFKVGKLIVGGKKTIIIAEVGVNHLKRLDYAEKLIKTASNAGADIIKFQTYNAEKLTTKKAPRFWKWNGERKKNGSQYDSYKVLATYNEQFTIALFKLCKKYKVEFMSTPFDLESARMLNRIGCPAFKIASGDITNIPLIKYISSFKKPIFLSTGASSIPEIKQAVSTIERSSDKIQICIMHCNLCYPTRPENANLGALKDIKKNFPKNVLGLSDHTIGPLIPSASIMLGAKVIEKHYTFDNDLPDSADHWLSINQDGLKKMVNMIRELEKAIGVPYKFVNESEIPAKNNARRSIVIKGGIKKGEKFSSKNLIMKRPGTGISPIYYDEIIGLTSSRDIQDDEIVFSDDVYEDASFKPLTSKIVKKL